MRQRRFKLRLFALLALTAIGSVVNPISTVRAADGGASAYPFRTGSEGFVNGVTWTGPAAQTESYWQFFQANFDGGAQNLASADYLAIQYRADVGSPGFTFGVIVNGDRYGTAGVADNTVSTYFMDESGNVSDLGKIMYASVWVPQGSTGALLLPLKSLGWQWNNNSSTLASIASFYITTNSTYNYGWTASIGDIGYWVGEPGAAGTTYTSLLDVSAAPKLSSYYYDSTLTTSLKVITGYPLETGDKAFNGGQKWIGPSAASTGDSWETIFVNFKTNVDLTQATALAVQYRADQGAPGLTWGVENSGTRYSTQVDGEPVNFLDEGTLTPYQVTTVLYAAVSIPEGNVGMALLPMSSLHYQFGDAGHDLSSVNNFLLTTNSFYNYNFAVSVGAVGYLDASGVYHSIEIDYYYNGGAHTGMELIDVQDWQIASHTDYPFRLGEFEAYKNGKIWVAPATGATENDIQKLEISFDAVSDVSAASYLAIQFANTMGNPGLTFALRSGDDLYSIAGVADGQKVYWIKENGDIATAAAVLYSAATTSISAGVLLIPMSAMGWTTSGANSLATVTSLVVTTNRKYNYNFQAKFGEIGFYQGEIGETGTTFSKVLDLTSDKTSQFVSSGSLTNESSLIGTAERSIYGDTLVSVTGTGKNPANFSIWSGGSYGQVTMVEDTYGDTAMQLQATGSNPTGDAYTAISIAGAISGWAGNKGVTFWARNDSDGEVSFNLEMDCKVTATGVSDRFNIKQGNRFYLYDVNTGKTSIYMTKPTATLPVGFEGWVRIPFSAFNRADWSNNGVTKAMFMTEGTFVSYLAITIHSTSYLNMPFSLNKFGAYATTPTWSSAYVSGTSIPELMDLEA